MSSTRKSSLFATITSDGLPAWWVIFVRCCGWLNGPALVALVIGFSFDLFIPRGVTHFALTILVATTAACRALWYFFLRTRSNWE